MTDSSGDAQQQFSLHTSMKDLVHRYDGFILDQFGVLHNGREGLPGAPEAVQALHDNGKKLIILSNSSSSSEGCKDRLPPLGYNPDHFVNAVTSGEEAGRYVREQYGSTAKKALFITWKTPKSPSPLSFLDLCGDKIEITNDVNEADVVILHGVDVLRGPGKDGEASEESLGNFMEDGKFDKIDPLLELCSQRCLRMICCNPDFIMVQPNGDIGHMPGKIAERYEKQYNGNVMSFGKPHKEHFEACLRELQLPEEKVCHVGDSLHHDVAGANSTGIASIFVTGGVHCEELGAECGSLPDREALTELFAKHQQIPTHVLPLFQF
jgi:HAD superfamily hydrolase (TIGR01450 family)